MHSSRFRIAREIVVDGGNGGFLDVLRRGEVRLANAEVNNVDSAGPQFLGFGGDSHRG